MAFEMCLCRSEEYQTIPELQRRASNILRVRTGCILDKSNILRYKKIVNKIYTFTALVQNKS